MWRRTSLSILECTTLFFPIASAQRWRSGDDNDGSQRPPYLGGNIDDDSPVAIYWGRFQFTRSISGQRALVAHAVIASLVWVFLIPTGGILLRLNIRSPWVLRVHAMLQVSSYVLFIIAAGLGIHLARHMDDGGFLSPWHEPHVRLGLTILVLAFFQPILGVIHHVVFKRRVARAKDGKPGPLPGRTVPGHMHLWLGRTLILLGMINGGLGVGLAWLNPFQSRGTTRKVCIAYSVCAGIMGIIYLIVATRFEVNKAELNRKAREEKDAADPVDDVPPAYTESQDSLQKDHSGATRYG